MGIPAYFTCRKSLTSPQPTQHSIRNAWIVNALKEPCHSDNLLARLEKLYLGNSNIAYFLSEDGIYYLL